MRVLITAGGTSEKIDNVRSITNHSTGRLGCLVAENFLDKEAVVDYVTTAQAKHPVENEYLQTYEIAGTQELTKRLQQLLQKNHYDAVIHSMAVSDFTPAQTFSQEDFLEKMNQLFKEKNGPLDKQDLAHLTAIATSNEKKISSDTEQLYLVLEKTPKVIQLIKQMQPETLLVGFKLLVDVSKQSLLATAQESIQNNQADYILANDLAKITENQHIGYLIDKYGQMIGEKHTKQNIASLIVETIIAQNTSS